MKKFEPEADVKHLEVKEDEFLSKQNQKVGEELELPLPKESKIKTVGYEGSEDIFDEDEAEEEFIEEVPLDAPNFNATNVQEESFFGIRVTVKKSKSSIDFEKTIAEFQIHRDPDGAINCAYNSDHSNRTVTANLILERDLDTDRVLSIILLLDNQSKQPLRFDGSTDKLLVQDSNKKFHVLGFDPDYPKKDLAPGQGTFIKVPISKLPAIKKGDISLIFYEAHLDDILLVIKPIPGKSLEIISSETTEASE